MQPAQRNVRRLRWLAVLIVPCLVLLALGSAWMLGRDDTIEIDSSDLTYRFIRIKYDGQGWDDGMDAVSRADINFLDYFHKLTGFKTASQSEALAISLLAKYPKGYAPPMVYMTGDGKINVPDRDVQIMREYLMSGGMLFADCGSPAWHGAFADFIQRVFPGENLITIPDDDTIFQVPFSFESVAPPIWHHGGRDALGIKYKGRWAVFYHPAETLGKQDPMKAAPDSRTHDRTLGTTNKSVADLAPSSMPWTRYPLASVNAFDGTANTNLALQLIRRLIRPGSNLFAVLDTLGSIPYSAYDVSLAPDTPRSAIALMLDIRDAKTLLLVFENGEASAARPLLDSLLLTVESNRVTMLLDVIPCVACPRPADFRRALSWYGASLEPMDNERLEATRKRRPPSGPSGESIK